MENNKVSVGQSDKVDFASFLPTKQQKKTENAIPAATKKPQYDLKLFNGTPKFPDKFKKNYKLNSSVRRPDYVTTTTTTTKFTLKVLAFKTISRFSFCVFEELLHVFTFSQVHNGP